MKFFWGAPRVLYEPRWGNSPPKWMPMTGEVARTEPCRGRVVSFAVVPGADGRWGAYDVGTGVEGLIPLTDATFETAEEAKRYIEVMGAIGDIPD